MTVYCDCDRNSKECQKKGGEWAIPCVKTIIKILCISVVCFNVTRVVVNNIQHVRYIEQIRSESLKFFSEKCNVPIIYSSNIFNYSPDDYLTNPYCIVGTTSRNEDINDKYNLPIFNMLCVGALDRFISIDALLSYLKDYCKADMRKLGVVSITETNNLLLAGIEPYLKILNTYGIFDKNILIRQDVQAAYDDGSGDGCWRSPNIKGNICGTASIHFPLIENADINNYKNKNEWLEVAEVGLPGTSISDTIVFGIGMERIEYYFFNLDYPLK